jgi:hypothetical protein
MSETRLTANENEGMGYGCLETVSYDNPDNVYWRVKKGLEPSIRCRSDVFGALKDLEKLAGEEDEVLPKGAEDPYDVAFLTYVDVFKPDFKDERDTEWDMTFNME